MGKKRRRTRLLAAAATVFAFFLIVGAWAAAANFSGGEKDKSGDHMEKAAVKPHRITASIHGESEEQRETHAESESPRETEGKIPENQPPSDGEGAAEETDTPVQPLVIESDPALYTYEDMERDMKNMSLAYDDIIVDSLGTTADGREIYHALLGNPDASYHVLITASIHAREYITTQLVMKQMNEFLKNEEVKEAYLDKIAIHVVPMINPDGVSISQFGLDGVKTPEVKSYIQDVVMAADGSNGQGNYFSRWKSNARGVDLNRNFDALWEQYAGSGHPSSDHYKGEAIGSETEAAALITLTESYPFVRTVSYHTQGGVIYWYFGQTGQLKDDTLAFAQKISAVTGYWLDDNYQNLDPAGYKDWAISKKGIPSLTIEVGRDASPVPPEQLGRIWEENKGVWQAVCDSIPLEGRAAQS